jgi:putative ABC transport system ATP-binding protein
MPLIELKNIRKTFLVGDAEQTVLNDVDFQLNKGECVAFMGASGSGKSTLMNILGMLDKPTTGQYWLNSQKIGDLSEDERAHLRNRTIGFVFQSFFLLPRLTVLQNVGLPLRYRDCPEEEITERAYHMLDKVDMKNFAEQRPNHLSGGQQQRVAIARALIGDPAVILADEPTGSLDRATGKIVMDLFLRLNRNDHVTIIIVTHDHDIAAQCQRIVHLQDGKVVDV